MKKLRNNLYDTKSVGVLYSAAIVLLVLLSFLFSLVILIGRITVQTEPSYPDWYIYCSYLLPQIAFGGAVVLFFACTTAEPKEVYRPAKWQYYLLAVLLQFGLFSLSWVNDQFVDVLNKLMGYEGEMTIPDLTGGGIVWAILVIAVLPAIFEESIFRGLLLPPMQKFSTPVAVLLSGALFALYHQSPQQTVYQFICGCAFALVAIRARSVLPTMLSHFLNNAVILILCACGIDEFSGVGGIIFYVFSAVALVVATALLLFTGKDTNTKKTAEVKPFLRYASVGIAICAVLWVANLLGGVFGVN
jgi:membrane protease YdiL (CAAX protease family)